MADGKLVFPVKFDLEAAVKEASGDADRVLKRLGTMINSRPLKLGIEIEQPKGGWDKKLGDYGKGSINAMRKEMEKLVAQWNKLSEAQRITDQKSGAFTADAMKIINRYSQLVTASESYARSLEQIASAAKKSADAEIRANQKAQAEVEKRVARSQQTVAMLKAEETSLSAVAAKMKFYQQIADKSDFGSKSFLYATQQVERLGAQYQRLQNIMTSATGNKGKDIFNTEQLKQTLRGAESSIEQVKAKLRAVDQILAKTPQDSFGFRRASEEGERLLRLLKDMEANTPKAQIKAQEQLQREWLAAKDQREREREKETQQAIANANRENQARQAAFNAQRQAGLERQRILNAEANSIAIVTKQLQIQQERLNNAKVGSAKYNRLTEEVDRLTKKLNLMQEALQAAGKRVEALRAMREILSASEKTISGITGKLQVYQERLKGLEVGSQKFNKTAAEVRRLSEELQRANQYLSDFQSKAFRGLSTNFTARQTEEVQNLRRQIDEIDKKFNMLYQNGRATKADGTYTDRVNAMLKERMRLTEEINKMMKTAADAQLEREKEINRIQEQRKAKAQAIADKKKAETKATQDNIAKLKEERRVLNQQESSIKAITDKLNIMQRRLNSTNIKSGQFEKIAKEVERLTKKLDEARRKVAELTGQSTSGANTQAKNARKVNQEYSKQLTYLDRLVRRMAVYGSIGLIGNFLRNIREVTAQFELQRISLGAILQDQTKANQLFSEIKGFALKSPVSILDLTKYTKQLAAYKIGYDELFETTKKLTDVSVGLGVSMDRVVLAYGQVRATGHLRASEIRQFTEMGVPIVEELAAKLSKMNGELVTAGQVMDMVSKRAIGFDMVKEVFDDMTSAGGIFYNMQEKQGNTLYGLWAKLGDAASVMYDEIGRTGPVNSVMKGLIQSATDLMKNWRMVSGEIAVAVIGFGAYKLAQNLATKSTIAASKATRDYVRAQTQLNAAQKSGSAMAIGSARASMRAAAANRAAALSTNAWTAAKYRLIGATNSLKAALMGNWITLTITAIAAIAVAIGTAIEKATRLKRALNDIEAETINLQNQSIGRFEHLAEAAVNAADGSKKQRDALAELSRTYGDILPQDALKLENLRKMNHSYGELTATLREHIATQQMQKGLSEISETYGAKINKASKNLIDGLVSEMKIGRDVAANIVGEMQRDFQEKLEKGERDTRTITQRMIASAKKYGVEMSNLQAANAGSPWYDLIWASDKYLVEFYNALGDMSRESSDFENRMKGMAGATYEFQKSIEETKKKVSELTLNNPDGTPINENTLLGQQVKANETMKVVADMIKSDTSIKDAIKDKETEWNEDWIHLVTSVDPDNLMEITTINFDAIIKALNSKYPQIADKIRQIQKEWGNIAPTNPTAVQIRQKLLDVSESFGVSIDKMKKYLWDGSGSVDDYLKRLKEQQETLKARLKEKEQTLLNMGVISKWWNKLLGKDIEAEVEQMKKEIEALDKLVPFTEEYTVQKEKKSGGRQSDPRLQSLKEEISLVQKLYQEYKQLEKQEGATKATADMNRMAKDTIAMLSKKYGIGLPKTANDVVTALEILYGKMEQLPRKVFPSLDKDLKELRWTIEKVDIDDSQKNIEAELKKLADKISRTKTAKEFYEKILRQTGDVDLAMHATVSVYGINQFDVFEDELAQLKEWFANIDISGAINRDLKQIDYSKLREIWETDKSLPENLRKIPEAFDSSIKSLIENGEKYSRKQYERWSKDLEKAKQYADKRIEIASYTAENIQELQGKIEMLDVGNPNYSAAKAKYESMIKDYREREKNENAKLDYEQIKEQIGMFDDLGILLSQSFGKILMQLKQYTQSPEFARLGLEAQKNVFTQIQKIEERMEQGFHGIAPKTVSKMVREYSVAASQYLSAQEELKEATLAAIEVDKRLAEAKAKGDKATEKTLLTEKQLADARVNTATATYNQAGASLQRAQMNAQQATNRFEGNIEKAHAAISNMLTLDKGTLKKLWDMLGTKSHDKIGQFLAGTLKAVNAVDKLNKVLAESDSTITDLSAQIASTLGDLASSIDFSQVEEATKQVTDIISKQLAQVGLNAAQSQLIAQSIGDSIAKMMQSGATQDAIASGTEGLIKALGEGGQKSGNLWGAIIGLILQLLDEFAENGIGEFIKQLLENVGDAVNGILSELLETTIPNILEGIGDLVKNVAYGIVNLLTFSAFDLGGRKAVKKANKIIEEQQDLLEGLQYTYSRLQKTADKLFGGEYIRNYNQQLKNLEAQAEAYQKQAEAEKSKGKKTDEEKLKEYENAYRDTMDEIADMYGQLMEKMTGTDVASAARDFANAWLDAYISFGNTADAIKDKFKDMIKNMIVESIMAKTVQIALQPMFDEVEKMYRDGASMVDVITYMFSQADKKANEINDGLMVNAKLMESLGIDLKSLREGEGNLTGIAKSVATATSEEINANTAALNTQNYYLSHVPVIGENVAAIRMILQGGSATVSSGTGTATTIDYTDLLTAANQHLASLPRMERHLSDIYTLLNRVVTYEKGRFVVSSFLRS